MSRPWAYLASLGLSACASVVAAPSAPEASAVSATAEVHNSDMDAQLMYRVLTAEIAQQAQVHDIAFGLMLEAAKSRQDDALYERAIAIASQARAGNSALKAAKLWRQNMPESINAMRQTLGLELALQRSDDAADSLKRLFKAMPLEDMPALATQLPAALQRLPDAAQRQRLAQEALRTLLNDPQRGAYAHAVLGTLAIQNQDLSGALQHAREGLALQADNASVATLAVALLEQGEDQAEALVLGHLDQAEASPRVRMFYVRQLLQSNWLAPAFDQLKTLTARHPDQRDAWLLLGRLELDRKRYDAAQSSTEKALGDADPQRDTVAQRALMQLAEIAQAQQQWDQAQAHLARITAPEDDLQWLYQRASLQAAQGDLPGALALLATWPAPDDDARLRRLWREVQLLREFEALDQAYARLASAREQFPNNNDLIYTQAMVAERLKRYDDMERLLRLHIEREPQDHQALNALGYSLADRGVRLVEAKTLIQAALSQVPQDPFVTDSLGWVLFRLGEHEQAIEVLQRAWASRSDAEIAAHLGEVLWTVGRQDEAKQTWAQGLALSPDNDTLRSTLRRLGVRL